MYHTPKNLESTEIHKIFLKNASYRDLFETLMYQPRLNSIEEKVSNKKITLKNSSLSLMETSRNKDTKLFERR